MGGLNCCFGDTNSDDTTSLSRNDQLSQQQRSGQVRRSSGGQRHREHRRQRVSVPQTRQHVDLFRPTSATSSPLQQQPGSHTSSDSTEKLKLAQRKHLIDQIPTGLFDMNSKKHTECAICMIDFEVGDGVKYLPCMHVYHKDCVDDWLMRSLRCPSCMEPVDAALLSSFDSFT